MLVLVSCTRTYTPKPYGYVRIDLPEAEYQQVSYGPYCFMMSTAAEIRALHRLGEPYWVDIYYPSLRTSIHCSYKAVQGFRDAEHQGNLPQLTADALEFVYKHTAKASAIPEQSFANDEDHVYGVYFELEGNTASPCQFFVTDSVHHFFRGAVYSNCRPNADSLAPIHRFLKNDIRVIMETFRWN